MQMKTDFPALYNFCVGYFHQDWNLDDPTAEAVVRRFMNDDGPQGVQQLRAEIDRFLRVSKSEEQRAAILDAWGCCYYPPGDGLSYTDWLKQVSELLTESQSQ